MKTRYSTGGGAKLLSLTRFVLLFGLILFGLMAQAQVDNGGGSGDEEVPIINPCDELASQVSFDLLEPSYALGQEFTLTVHWPDTDPTWVFKGWEVFGMGSEFGWDSINPGKVWPACGVGGEKNITIKFFNTEWNCYITKSVNFAVTECDLTHLSHISDGPQEGTIDVPSYVDGQIIVEAGKTFIVQGTHLYFRGVGGHDGTYPGGYASGSSILVKSGGTLIVREGATLAAACGEMWAGIKTEDGATVSITNSIVRDAYIALEAVSTITMNIEDSKFINNFLGLYYYNSSTASTLKRNRFHSDHQGFMVPFDQCYNEGTFGNYGNLHTLYGIISNRDLSNSATQNTLLFDRQYFKRCVIGISADHNYSSLKGCYFKECYVAGFICQPDSVFFTDFRVEKSTFDIPSRVQKTYFTEMESIDRSFSDSYFSARPASGAIITKTITTVESCRFFKTDFGISQGHGEQTNGLYMNGNMTISKNEFADLNYGFRTTGRRENVLVYGFNSNKIKDCSYGVYLGYNLLPRTTVVQGFTCNFFETTTSSVTNPQYGLYISHDCNMPYSTNYGMVLNASDTSGTPKAGGNVFPVAGNTGNRTLEYDNSVSPPEAIYDVEDFSHYNWSSPTGWTSIYNASFIPLHYERYENEFVGRVWQLAPDSLKWTLFSRRACHMPNCPSNISNLDQICYGNSPAIPDGIEYFPLSRIGKPTGLQTAIPNKAVRLIPNPATDKVLVTAEEVTLFNYLGELMKVSSIRKEDGTELSLTNLPRGIYTLRCLNSEGNYTALKLVKN